MSNNITIVFYRPFSFHVLAIYIEACIQSQCKKASFLAFAISMLSVFGPANGIMQVEGLNLN